jgi:hypothetical protein
VSLIWQANQIVEKGSNLGSQKYGNRLIDTPIPHVSNPESRKGSVDCFVAHAPRNDG